jgi:hypothetical protein
MEDDKNWIAQRNDRTSLSLFSLFCPQYVSMASLKSAYFILTFNIEVEIDVCI